MRNLILVLFLLGAGVFVWKNHFSPSATETQPSINGFVSVVSPAGAPPDTVIILAPLHCSSDDSKRADDLSARLRSLNIPNIRQASYTSSDGITSEHEAALRRTQTVLNGELPVVFLRGMAINNPAIEDVVNEYNQDE